MKKMVSDLTIFNFLNRAALLLEADGRIIEINKAACELFALEADEEKQVVLCCYNLLSNQEYVCGGCRKNICPLNLALKDGKRHEGTCYYSGSDMFLIVGTVVTPLETAELFLMELDARGKLSGLENGIVHMCSFCHRIQDSDSRWVQVENFFGTHLGISFSHTICEECGQKYYPEYWKKRNRNKGDN